MDESPTKEYEREVKLDVASTFVLPSLVDVDGRFDAVELGVRELDATYYDTEDLRLARSGLTLRFRTGDARPWTLKLPDSGAERELIRLEVSVDGPPDRIPRELADMVLGYTLGATLTSAVVLRSRRRVVEIRCDSGRVVEVVDDLVDVIDQHGTASQFREIEIEFVPETPSELIEDLLRRLRDAGAVDSMRVPKAIRAMGRAALAPPIVPSPELPADESASKLAAGLMKRGVAALLTADLAVRTAEDADLSGIKSTLAAIAWNQRSMAPLLPPTSVLVAERVGQLRSMLDQVDRTALYSAEYVALLSDIVEAVGDG